MIGEAIRVSMPVAELAMIAGFAFVLGFVVGVMINRPWKD